MASHATLGVVRAGVAVLKGMLESLQRLVSANRILGTGIRINCISAGQIDVGVDLQNVSFARNICGLETHNDIVQFDMKGMAAQFPPASLQSKEVRKFFNDRKDFMSITCWQY